MQRTPSKVDKQQFSQVTMVGKMKDSTTNSNKTFTKEDFPKPNWKLAKENSGKESDEMEGVWTGGPGGRGEDEDKCRECQKKVKDDHMGVVCDYCQYWFHIECANISRNEYKMINAMEEKVKWYCLRCSEGVEKIQKENVELKELNSQLKIQNQELKQFVEQLGDRISEIERNMELKIEKMISKKFEEAIFVREKQIFQKLEEEQQKYDEHHRVQVKNLGVETVAEIRNLEAKFKQQNLGAENIEQIQKKVMENCIHEITQKKLLRIEQHNEINDNNSKVNGSQIRDIEVKLEKLEKEKRKNNLIIYNLQESDSKVPLQRYRDDEIHMKKIFEQELHRKNFNIVKIIRLGRKTEDVRRPTLVELGSEKEKMDILVHAKEMRHSTEYPKLYINRDLTADERLKEKNLRDQLREKRREGQNDYIIRNGRIVNKQNENMVNANHTKNGDSMVEGAVGIGARRKTGGNFQ